MAFAESASRGVKQKFMPLMLKNILRFSKIGQSVFVDKTWRSSFDTEGDKKLWTSSADTMKMLGK